MRITKRTSLAMRVLMFCAANPGRIVTKAEIARSVNASENHLGHVVNRLAQLGLLRTIRGRRGGMTLAHAPRDISVGAVFRRFEADVPVTTCFAGGDGTCPLARVCRLKGELHCAVEAFYAHLDPVTLDQLIAGNEGLGEILALEDAA